MKLDISLSPRVNPSSLPRPSPSPTRPPTSSRPASPSSDQPLENMLDQVEHTRVLNVVYRSATALGSRLPSIANSKARVAGAGALLRPVSSSTQVVTKRAQMVP